MNIQQVHIAPQNWSPGRQGQSVQGIILHTIVGSLSSADVTFSNPTRQASAHYGVAYDGSVIHQWVQEGDTAWHCGRWASDNAHPLANLTTIGIEHDDQGRYNDPRPDALYTASAKLVADICQRYNFLPTEAHIQPHRNVSIAPTGCPDALDWQRIIREAAQILSPVPPPPNDWKVNAKADARTYTLVKTVNLLDINTDSAVSQVPAGTVLQTAYSTVMNTKTYLITAYSYAKDIAHGFLESDILAASQPPPPSPADVIAALKVQVASLTAQVVERDAIIAQDRTALMQIQTLAGGRLK